MYSKLRARKKVYFMFTYSVPTHWKTTEFLYPVQMQDNIFISIHCLFLWKPTPTCLGLKNFVVF